VLSVQHRNVQDLGKEITGIRPILPALRSEKKLTFFSLTWFGNNYFLDYQKSSSM